MRFASHECRWFFEGPLEGSHGDEVVRRFRSAGDWPTSTELEEPEWPARWREDRYLVLPAGDGSAAADMGIKWRDEIVEGKPWRRLEYKGLTSVIGPVSLGAAAIGRVEQWIKWSYAGDEVPSSAVAPFMEGRTAVPVRKVRLQRKLRLDASGHDEEIPTSGRESFVDRAMFIELTKIRTERYGDHWTLGFEASPQDPGIHEDFCRNAEVFLNDFAGAAELTEDRSMSYPEWLRRMAGR